MWRYSHSYLTNLSYLLNLTISRIENGYLRTIHRKLERHLEIDWTPLCTVHYSSNTEQTNLSTFPTKHWYLLRYRFLTKNICKLICCKSNLMILHVQLTYEILFCVLVLLCKTGILFWLFRAVSKFHISQPISKTSQWSSFLSDRRLLREIK